MLRSGNMHIMVKGITLIAIIVTSCFFFGSCKKKTSTPYPQTYTAKMGGVRTWTGTYDWGFNGPGPQGDTQTFAITVNSASTVTVQGTAVYYRSYNDAAKSMLFAGPSPVTIQDSVAITYYFLADSIVYYSYSRPTLCCYETYYLSTKK